MIDITIAGIGFVLLLVFMASGLHVAFVMFALSMLGAMLYLGWPATLEFGTQYWGATNNFVLVAIPLFVLLGELLVRGGFTDRMYRSLSDWLNPLPGGPAPHQHRRLGACSPPSRGRRSPPPRRSAPSRSRRSRGAATTPRLVLGSIAAGATLGILIPPSINMIIYGAMTNTSVGRLYAAGVIPGLLLTALFMLVIVVACWWKPAFAGAVEAPAPLGGAAAAARRPDPAGRHLPGGDGQHLPRLGHADRVGRARGRDVARDLRVPTAPCR